MSQNFYFLLELGCLNKCHKNDKKYLSKSVFSICINMIHINITKMIKSKYITKTVFSTCNHKINVNKAKMVKISPESCTLILW